METVNTNVAPPPATAEGEEISGGRFLSNRGRTPSPPLKNRVIVFDCREGTIGVENKKDFDKRTALQLSQVHDQC